MSIACAHVLDLSFPKNAVQNGHFFSSWKKQSSVVSKKTLREKEEGARKAKSIIHVWSDDASAEKTKRGERCVGFDCK